MNPCITRVVSERFKGYVVAIKRYTPTKLRLASPESLVTKFSLEMFWG